MVRNFRNVVRQDSARGRACARSGKRANPQAETRLPLPFCSQIPQPRKAQFNPSRHAGVRGGAEDSAFSGNCRRGSFVVDVARRGLTPCTSINKPVGASDHFLAMLPRITTTDAAGKLYSVFF